MLAPRPAPILSLATGERDLADVRELLREYGASLGYALCFASYETELATLPGDYAPPRGRLVIARSGGAAIGCVALRPCGEFGEMKRLYVRPEARGSGLGRALVEHVVGEARAIGHRGVRLDTLPSMHAARALYVALGFRPIARYDEASPEGAAYFELAF